MYKRYFKRLFDLILFIPAFIIALPFMIVISAISFFAFKQGIIFKQNRTGFREATFSIYKFRTIEQGDEEVLLVEEKLSKWGKFLRQYSLDELPQLLNILLGEMSFIGPRPLLLEYLQYYTKLERQRHDLRPGLTGLAQVMGRNEISWDMRLAYDIDYLNNISLFVDIQILFKTVAKVLSKQSQHHSESLTKSRKSQG